MNPLKMTFAATLVCGVALAQAPASPTAPATPVAPPAAIAPPSPGAPEAPVAPGTLPEQAAPAPAAQSPVPKTPTGSAAAQLSVPSGEVAKAQQTGQSAHGGKLTEDSPTDAKSTAKAKKSIRKHHARTMTPQQ